MYLPIIFFVLTCFVTTNMTVATYSCFHNFGRLLRPMHTAHDPYVEPCVRPVPTGSVHWPLVIYGPLRRSFAESSKSPQHHTRKRRLITPGVSFPRYSVLFCLTWYALGHYLNYLSAGGRPLPPRCLM